MNGHGLRMLSSPVPADRCSALRSLNKMNKGLFTLDESCSPFHCFDDENGMDAARLADSRRWL
jgi:hypothetical protein